MLLLHVAAAAAIAFPQGPPLDDLCMHWQAAKSCGRHFVEDRRRSAFAPSGAGALPLMVLHDRPTVAERARV
jgi:hypothetical protein